MARGSLLAYFDATAPIRRQLSLLVTIGVLGLALITSAATSWRASQQIRAGLENQGIRAAETLARQSKLALLYGSAENASEAVASTLSFADVVAVEVVDAVGKRLIARGKTAGGTGTDAGIPLGLEAGHAFVEEETGSDWRFVAPVMAGEGSASPFESEVRRPELLGYVRVIQNKATLTGLVWNIVLVNFGISFLFAFALLAFLRLITNRMTQPLVDLSELMARAEAGEANIRATMAGPRDVADMAHAFNSMMTVLEERERDLRQARDEALAFARLKAEFAAMVSHEVRTPLNGVVGTLDMLKATTLPPKQREFVNLAWDSAQYLLELINNILDFSRLEAGKVELESASLSIRHLVEDVLELLAPQAHQKGLEIGYLADADVPGRVLGDANRLKQVLTNLVGNAIKFTESGEISVRVSTVRRGTAGEPALRIEVNDTGIGIAEETRVRIFDSFTQADTSTTRRYGGSGLGLAICKQLVGLMAGSIGVDSTAGRGSRFWFVVPAPAESEVAGGQRILGHGRLALVVSHSPIVARFLEQQLSGWGFTCHAASTADEALGLLREGGADSALAFVDAEFAAAAGGELVQRLRADPQLGAVRLILMHDYGLGREPVSTDANAYLAKPIRLERLYECVTGQMEVAQEAAPGSAAAARGRNANVLVVEDNRTNQVVAQGMLHMLGCKVEIADGGRQALLAFKRQPWDLILMDCAMPEMDGYQVTAAIRAMEAEQGIRTPIVAMTANTQPADMEKCLAAGMDDHLGKPLTLDSVAGKLDRWISGSRVQPSEGGEVRAEAEHFLGGAVEALDRGTFNRLRAMLGDAIGDAVSPFLEDMPRYLDEIAQAAANGDAEALRKAAHAVKGAAGNLGATLLADAAKEVEDLAAAGRVPDAGEAVDRLPAEFALVRQALMAELRVGNIEAEEAAAGSALVLVVDDDRSTRTALRHALQRGGFRTEEAGDGVQALALLERIHPDVILMDALMPELDGFATCARLQEMPHTRDIPVLMITALEDSHSIERAFMAGASDYIPKPIQFSVVQQRVRRLVDANRTERYVRHLSYSDAVTGLPNRVMFTEQLSRMLDRSGAAQSPVAVLFLDLDRFKFVNDTLGHEIGDHLLKTVAQRIKECVRANDCVARLGGDEFSVALDELPSAGVAAVAAQKICRTLAEPFVIDDHEIFVTASIGISVFPEDGLDVSTLLRHADTAMYRAKKSGSGFHFYEAGMDASMSAHLRLENSLRRALEREELEIFYQPIATCGGDVITGAEALLRWRHPGRGLVSPAEFIPIAEETGLILPMGEWVLRGACEQITRWLASHGRGLHVAVNLSGKQLQQPRFVETVRRIIEETQVPPEHLTLEITESVVMEHARETIATLNQLKNLGVSLAIDDFGTGYSSLSYLKRFPVDVLKIDRSFTMDVPRDADDAAIVTGIIALAHSLRLKVIAEGVETEEQRQFLMNLGCDYIQGFLLSQPIPAAEFESRFHSQAASPLKTR